MSEVSNIPQLRFSEFNGNWEEVPFYDCLNDILDFRGRTPLKIGMDWGGGNIISLSANNVKNGYIDFNAECHLGSEELYEKWMGKVKLVKNDIVFTMEAPLGKALLVPDDERYILSQRVVAFKTRDYIDNLYFIQLIWNNKFQNTVHRLSTGSTAKGINQKSLKKVFINIPLKPEQNKIAAFLTAIDNKIEQLNKKQELLGEYKKGLMQQIFSQAIRFKADDGSEFPDWEEKKLGEVSVRGVSNISANQLENNEGEYKIYGASGHLKNIDFYTENEPYIAIVKDGAGVGRTMVLEPETSVLGTLAIIKAKKGNDINFLYWLVQTINFKKYVVGSTIPHIYYRDYQAEKLIIPSLKEQTKIANFLSSIDNKIEQAGKQLGESKLFKKALLQQMFV